MPASVSMPFEDGVRFEREAFAQLVETPESRALRHAFFAERAATKIPGIDAAKFKELTGMAEKGCPVSKVLKAEISLDAELV